MEGSSLPLTNVPERRRRLILRDAWKFFVLTMATLLLYGITTFLFHTFESHREELAERWTERGREALQAGKPDIAVNAIRTALSFEPGDATKQRLLAEALAESGPKHTEEAKNYFLNLREHKPGDGDLNLQLARLTRRTGNAADAVDYYRASIFGSWNGDGVSRRRAVRLELASYLIQRGQKQAAQAEVLVAAGNAPESAGLDVVLGNLLAQTDDENDALTYYNKALKLEPNNVGALMSAAALYRNTGKYEQAHALYERVAAEKSTPAPKRMDATAKAAETQRLQQLNFGDGLPQAERVDHVLAAAKVAQTRLSRCAEPTDMSGEATLPTLDGRWAKVKLSRRVLLQDNDALTALMQLITDTEQQTKDLCGVPHSDDALLLELSRTMVKHAGH